MQLVLAPSSLEAVGGFTKFLTAVEGVVTLVAVHPGQLEGNMDSVQSMYLTDQHYALLSSRPDPARRGVSIRD
jgi:hypothetical protein